MDVIRYWMFKNPKTNNIAHVIKKTKQFAQKINPVAVSFREKEAIPILFMSCSVE